MSQETKDLLYKASRKYFAELADKVDNNELTFKEGFAWFAAGGILMEILILLDKAIYSWMMG